MKKYRQKTILPLRNESYPAKTLNQELREMLNRGEGIKATQPTLYGEDEYDPSTDIRTDRWEIAMMASDKVEAAKIAKSENKPTEKAAEKNE